jgi:C1A family cysteine protease
MLLYLEADTYTFQGYYSGIINSSCCFAGKVLNHVVVLVGWRVDAQQSAWIIRNSWGTGWGVGGYAYIKMTNTGSGVCGEQNYAFGMKMAIVP